MKKRTAWNAKNDLFQRKGRIRMSCLVLHNRQHVKERGKSALWRWLETERCGSNNLALSAPVARVFAVAAGDVFTVEQVIDVNRNG